MIKPNLINRTIDVVNHINDQANRKENEMQVSKKNYYIYTHIFKKILLFPYTFAYTYREIKM